MIDVQFLLLIFFFSFISKYHLHVYNVLSCTWRMILVLKLWFSVFFHFEIKLRRVETSILWVFTKYHDAFYLSKFTQISLHYFNFASKIVKLSTTSRHQIDTFDEQIYVVCVFNALFFFLFNKNQSRHADWNYW